MGGKLADEHQPITKENKTMRKRVLRRMWIMVGMVFGMLALAAPAAWAADFTVTNTNDSKAGSLRQAIIDANSSKDADTIKFNIPGTGVRKISPRRSEERRVGKECRSRWSPYH